MRKHLLLAATFILSLNVYSFAQSRHTTYVIVHGAWGGSWSFKKTDSLLTAQGHTVYRPSLTGLGERVHLASESVNLTTHINDVVNMILFEELKDIVLVGHSYGGMVITGVADRIPERIRKMIYLDAFVPNDGESLQSIQGKEFDRLMAMNKNGMLVPPWIKADQPFPRDVPHPIHTFTEPVSLTNPAAIKLPAVYILTIDAGKKAEDDTFFSSSQRAKQRGWNVISMVADHNPQWSKINELVNLLLSNR